VSARAARGVAAGVSAVLAVAALATVAFVHDFGQHRFFTIDEYQYGHAAWLVSQGRIPYVDFYEHHFPLSYVLTAPLLPDAGSFVDRALFLRSVAFAFLALAAAALGLCGWRSSGDASQAWLLVCLPLGFGFGLMSAVDYRADNLAACLMLVCLALLDWNRAARRRATAAAAGVIFALAAAMTQKMVLLGGGAIAALLAVDLVRRRVAPGDARAFVAHPLVFVGSGAALGLLLLAVGAALGMLPAAWETTILHTLEHEAHYREIDAGVYWRPFLAETRGSTVAIAVCAAALAWFRSGGFWLLPLAVALAGGAAMQAPYPYNFVYPGFLLSVCAVKGFGAIVAALRRRRPSPFWALLYLLPLVALADQLHFVTGRTSNAHQLRLLRKIETYSASADAVIDGAGGALFRDHGSYYWYHGDAHRRMFRDYFADELAADYRRSAALFWIDDFRQQELPDRVRGYFRRHYVHVDGDLYALGFTTPATRAEPHARTVDLLRDADYRIFEVEVAGGARRVLPLRAERAEALRIDGRAVPGGPVRLEAGRHRVEVAPDAPAFLVTPLPREAFDETIGRDAEHSPLFEYERVADSASAR